MGEHALPTAPAAARPEAAGPSGAGPSAAGPDGVARELAEFEAGRRDPATFDHRAHVRLAHAMLARYPFERALLRYARGLRRTAARAGAPGKFHMTVTVAFLAVIAERRATAAAGDETWDAFARANPDLLDPGCLRRWYAPARLASAEARRTFLLPEPAGAALGAPDAA